MTPIGPIGPGERINSLDTLRGFALLGILPANVLVFGMFLAAGNDPTVAGGATGLNLASWALFRIVVERRKPRKRLPPGAAWRQLPLQEAIKCLCSRTWSAAGPWR
jgi:hypothetical protein